MTIYVGNLPYTTRDEELRALFEQYGEVTSSSVMKDRETGKSRGFGFIDMASDEAATAAIEAIHDSEFKGRALVVNQARPRQERNDRPRRFDGGGSRGRY